MKKYILGIIILYSLSGCQASINQEVKDVNSIEEFTEPESSDWVEYTNPVREYMYYRTQAVINDEIEILWKRYPHLKDHSDLQQGVNAERQEVKTLNEGFDFIDANYNIESYERIKVKTISENEVIVLVHGSIVFVRKDFEESGGEYLIKVYLEKQDGEWTVMKTDEYTLPEYKEWVKEKK